MDTVKLWWTERKRLPFSEHLVSDHGYLASSEGTPIAALFLFPTVGSSIALVGWPISSPHTVKCERDIALNELFDTIHAEARSMGFKMLWSFSGVLPVQERLTDLGYVAGDRDVVQYYKVL